MKSNQSTTRKLPTAQIVLPFVLLIAGTLILLVGTIQNHGIDTDVPTDTPIPLAYIERVSHGAELAEFAVEYDIGMHHGDAIETVRIRQRNLTENVLTDPDTPPYVIFSGHSVDVYKPAEHMYPKE